MKLLAITDVQYLRRLAREINSLQFKAAPFYRCSGSQFNGRRIMHAWVKDGCLIGQSLNGEQFPINPDMVFNTFDNSQVCASREPRKITSANDAYNSRMFGVEPIT